MFSRASKYSPKNKREKKIVIGKYPHGLNTFLPPEQIAPTEASELVNWKLTKGGRKVPRNGITVYSNSAPTGTIKQLGKVTIGGTAYELIIDSSYKVYYLDASLDPTLIGTLEGDATMLNYNDVVMLFDGSYIKYCDSVSSIKIAYDAADYQFDFTANPQDTSLNNQSLTSHKIGQKFTTQAWTAGYEMPPLNIKLYMRKVGNPVWSCTGYVERVSDGMKSGVFDANLDENLTTSFIEVSLNIKAPADFLEPNTDYYVYISHSFGGAADYIEVACTVNTGASGLAYTKTGAGAWTLDNTKDVVCSVAPSRPPKASYGAIWNNRPMMWGDPGELGNIHYGNLTYLDYSTSNGGGTFGVVDGDGDAYKVGAGISFYSDLYLFGTEEQPYLVKISGTEPNDYTQNVIFKEPWARYNCVVDAVNSIFYANSEGVYKISGVQEYGDLRSDIISEPVYDRIKDYWDTTSFLSYYPDDGQLWLVMPTYHRVLICHVKLGVEGPDGYMRYPWSEYEFYMYDFSSYLYSGFDNSGEYFIKTSAGDDPSISAKPDFAIYGDSIRDEGTAGSLLNGEWDYALDPTTTFQTIYYNNNETALDRNDKFRAIHIPKCMSSHDGELYIALSDGYVYKLNKDTIRDRAVIDINPKHTSSYQPYIGSYAEITKIQSMASCKSGRQLCGNNEFIADTYGWFPIGAATSESRVDSSVDPGTASGGDDSYCIKIEIVAASAAYVKQLIKVIPGEEYIISCQSYAPSSNTAVNANMFSIYDPSGDPLFTQIVGTVEDEWEELGATITAVGGYFVIYMYTLLGNIGDVAYFDKITCVPTANTSTFNADIKLDGNYGAPDITIGFDIPEQTSGAKQQLFEYTSFYCWSMMIGVDDVFYGDSLYDDGLIIWYRELSE